MDNPAGKKRILVLRYRFIGDTVLTVPFLRNLRRAEPHAFIAWVVAPGSAEVIREIPYVDELICWDPVTIHADSRGTHRTWKAKWQYIRELRRRHFDKVYVLKRSLSSALMAFLCGAPERIGFDTEGRGILLTRKVPYRHDRHEVENFLEVLRADGIEVLDDYLEYWTTPDEERRADDLLAQLGASGDERLVALHPFAAFPPRGWPLGSFAELSAKLAAAGYRPCLLGAPADRGLLEPVRALFDASCLDLVGVGNIRLTMALLRKAALFIGNDSGVMHLAAAAGIPMVALFGPQSPVRFGPWSERARVIYKQFSCSPCRQKFFTECEPSQRGKPACVEAITMDEVFREAVELLSMSDKK